MQQNFIFALGVLFLGLNMPALANGNGGDLDRRPRGSIVKRIEIAAVDCARPRNAYEAAGCQQLMNSLQQRPQQGVSPANQMPSDPLRQWCTEHTNPATCSPIQSCIEFCIQKSVGRDPAGVAAQLRAEHAAKQQQEKRQAAIAEKLELAKQQGYQPISFEDFKLDGKKLAETNAKVILKGFYSKFGDLEVLRPSALAVAMAREYGNDNGISLLSEDAARNVRKYFLECGDNPAAQLGCPITITGHADMCTLTNALLGSKNVPCLVVEDGW